jgi:hypothetical protein
VSRENWTTCCRGRRSSCPQVKVEDGFIYIRDDHGGEIKLTIPEYQMVTDMSLPLVADEMVRIHRVNSELRHLVATLD